MSTVRYSSSVWNGRPSATTWETLRPWIGYQKGISDTSIPPTYGHIIDSFREKYGIYISVYPHMQTETGKNNTTELAFRFQGICSVMPEVGTILKEYFYSGVDFPGVIKSLMLMAAGYLNNENKINNAANK